MPVILNPDNYDLWLDPGMKDAETAAEMLKPYDANAMRSYPISSRINHVANDDEECAAQVEGTKHYSATSTSPLWNPMLASTPL
jgi:putative SOS response-associated peptidase YedK